MVDLDSLAIYKKYDAEGMSEHLRLMPELCRQACQKATAFELPKDYSKIDNIVVLGMGGSAIGGSLVRGIAALEAKVPFEVCRDYKLPAYVGDNSLVVASSYSGNTEETLTAFEQALKTKARKLVMTTGGKLKTIAGQNDVPVFTFDYKAPPRAALAFGVLPLLIFLAKMGVVGDKSGDINETITILEQLVPRLQESAPTAKNAAKQMAGWLYGKIPVIYGAGIVSDVAYRWQTQLNENSKVMAFSQVLPEMNHNAVVGYQFPPDLEKKVGVVMLNSTYLNKRTQLRYKITSKLLEQAKISYQTVDVNGACPLSQVMGLVLLGDYISYYLAVLYGIDPTPVKVIDFLKNELGKEA